MKRFRHLLVALTGSPADRSALEWARLISAPASTRSIDVLMVDPDPSAWIPSYPSPDGLAPWQDHVHKTAEDVAEVFAASGGLEVETRTEVGGPLPTFLQELVDGEYDLVVVGVDNAEDRRLAEKLARKSPASVLSVPTGAATAVGSILTPLDFSGPSALALDVAAAFARSFDSARLDGLHAYRVPDPKKYLGPSYDSLLEDCERSAHRALGDFLDAQGLAFPVTPVVRPAPLAAPCILEELAVGGHDLLVMATRGRNSIAHALLGSNTADVLRSAQVPVLAVKAKGEGRTLLRSLLGEHLKPSSQPALNS